MKRRTNRRRERDRDTDKQVRERERAGKADSNLTDHILRDNSLLRTIIRGKMETAAGLNNSEWIEQTVGLLRGSFQVKPPN